MTISTPENETVLESFPSYIMSNILTKWTLEAYERSYLEKYYILHWETSYFEHKTKNNSAQINHDEIEYLILYPKYTIAQILDSKQVALSFRKLKSFLYGYVLVKPL